jgi:hypothetical protein
MHKSKPSKFLELLASEVASGCTIKDASAKIGIKTQTGYNISSDPSFQSRVAAIRSEAVAGAVGRLSIAANTAVDTLTSLLGEDNESRDRLNAAKAILATLGPLSELGELRARLDKLENSGLRLHG